MNYHKTVGYAVILQSLGVITKAEKQAMISNDHKQTNPHVKPKTPHNLS
ncbi:hypothetical protein [Alkalicoccobacillus murimartini]|uniref:Uncharacterized protein n=1 Tax=Alkalicoccobacillus murimartini TaxID=171685 RepID=A0ABT9YEE8_9BACI|nr:hypothetical protein [Alkalicoccobacillus murimartini]MDQ0206207.1 hypothetical protein [Alkalicoccobacillus murimartini]